MQLFYIAVIKNEAKPGHELCVETDLSSFSRFTRDNYKQLMSAGAKTIAERTKPGQRQDIEQRDYIFHSYGRPEGICGMIISTLDYPSMVAHQLLSKVVDEFLVSHPRSEWKEWDKSTPKFEWAALKEYLKQYQEPHQADNILKIQKELDETKVVLHKTIESVLERGENLDELVEKSEGLSTQSKMFYKQAKNQNSCCVAM